MTTPVYLFLDSDPALEDLAKDVPPGFSSMESSQLNPKSLPAAKQAAHATF